MKHNVSEKVTGHAFNQVYRKMGMQVDKQVNHNSTLQVNERVNNEVFWKVFWEVKRKVSLQLLKEIQS